MKLWDGVKHWMQNKEEFEELLEDEDEVESTKKDSKGDVEAGSMLLHEVDEPIDPKGWCSLNW